MTLVTSRSKLLLIVAFCLLIGFTTQVSHSAQTETPLPDRTAHVNDFAGAVDEKTRQQLELVLQRVQESTGIEFDVAVVGSTQGEDIYDFSRRLASKWRVGPYTRTKKSLLLVLAINEGASFTQISRSVQGDLPEGALAEMRQRMRGPVSEGNVSEGLSSGLQYFLSSLAKKLDVQAEDWTTIPSPITASETTEAKAPATSGESSSLTVSAAAAVRPRTITPRSVVREEPVETSTPKPASPDPPPATREQPVETSTPKPVVSDPPPATREEPVETSTPKPVVSDPPAITRDVTVESNTPKSVLSDMSEADKDESETVELTLTNPLPERISNLQQFLRDYPKSKSRARAQELLVSAHAGLGDDKLKRGDRAGGVEHFLEAIAEAPVDSTDLLFARVVSQIPSNLFIRGEHEAAIKAARAIEAKFGSNPARLLAVSNFYAGIEHTAEAARIANAVLKVDPDSSDAHLALGRALHLALKIDEAAVEYKRALDLNANSKSARRSLADSYRALGKPEPALELYRQQLAVDPTDKSARAGQIVSLLDLGRTSEARTQLDAALKEDPRNVPLLAGAAYWFAAHNDGATALSLAQKAVDLEPRYTWSHVAFARALISQRRPLDAERALRLARLYGKFPTLDYELASTLTALGLYDEAGEVLLQTFVLKGDQIEARLAGREPVQANSFIELLAPERRASIFQPVAADSENNARTLKALLAFGSIVQQASRGEKIDETAAVVAARQFAAGEDPSRVHRQLYAASRLLRLGIALPTVLELTEAARSSADAGLDIPAATLALQADEFRDIRARAIASGGTPTVPDAPRNLLSNLLRGRIEDVTGWALFNQDKVDEAINHLRRAANILPQGTPAWRTAHWHLGTALDQSGKKEEALGYYIKSYVAADPDPVRRAVIEDTYRKLNGSLAGLEDLLTRTEIELKSGASTEPASLTDTQPTATPENTSSTSAVASSTPPAVSPTTERPAEAPPIAKPTPATSSQIDSPVGEMLPSARKTVSIGGRVVDANNQPIANVVVVIISPQGTVLASTTNDQGIYSFKVAPSQLSYRLIPSKDGFAFQPVDKSVSGVFEDKLQMDFVGTRTP